MGLLSIIVSKEGLVELDFYDPKEDAPDPFGELEQFHPYHEKGEGWLDHYFAGDPIAISFPLAPQGTAFQERVWQLLQRSHMVRPKPMASLPRIFLVVQPKPWDRLSGRNPLTILVPCHRVMGKRWTTDGLCVWTRSQTLALTP